MDLTQSHRLLPPPVHRQTRPLLPLARPLPTNAPHLLKAQHPSLALAKRVKLPVSLQKLLRASTLQPTKTPKLPYPLLNRPWLPPKTDRKWLDIPPATHAETPPMPVLSRKQEWEMPNGTLGELSILRNRAKKLGITFLIELAIHIRP